MAVIIITVVSLTIIGATTILVSLILYSMSGWQHSIYAQIAAESIAEDTMLRLIRNPELTFSSDDTLEINGATARVFYTPPTESNQPHTIHARGTSGGYVRNIKIQYLILHGGPSILSWQAID